MWNRGIDLRREHHQAQQKELMQQQDSMLLPQRRLSENKGIHLLSQPSRKKRMDGLVVTPTPLHQQLLGNIQEEGTRERSDGLHKSTKTEKHKEHLF